MAEAERARLRVESPRCPYCHEAIAGGAAQLACNECRAWHHQSCWREAGCCAACGRAETGLAPPGAPAPAVRVPAARRGGPAPVRYQDRRGRSYTYRLPLGSWVLGNALILGLALAVGSVAAELARHGSGRTALWIIGGVVFLAPLALWRFETWSRRYDPE